MTRSRFAMAGSAVLVSMTLAGSAVLAQDADESAAPMTSAAPMAGTEVGVTLQEWAVIPDVMSVPAGSVTFDAQNISDDEPHELVVIRTDIPAGDLPTDEDGSVDEDAEGVEVIGEIEDLDPGTSGSGTWDLPPGKYALICNIVETEDDGEVEAHYQQGMWIDFEVTEPGASGEATGPAEPMEATDLGITLQEWAVIPDAMSVPEGLVTFNAQNAGPEDEHELVIVRTDIPAGELPTNEDGSFDEDAEGVEVIGEIEEFEPGTSESGTWNLPPGKYALLCNLVETEDDGEIEAHYHQGMWVEFEVTA